MSTNIYAKANLIWEVATKLVGVYKPHEYGKVILPMTVLKRFDDILKPTKQEVLEKYEEVKNFEVKEMFLTEASGYSFYNTSKYDFEKLLSDPDNIESNFKNYLAGFSENVQDILNNFKFENEVKTMIDNNLLYVIVQEFNSKKAYMGIDEVKTEDMGYIFEELVKRFSESYAEEAGAHFTARDIIYLMTDLLIADERELLINENTIRSVYDMTMGTSQMLSCMTDRIKQLNNSSKINTYGQESNSETYAIAKSDMLIRGGDVDNFRYGDTLSDDKFRGYKFDYIISNPPFGIDWKKQKNAVEEEAKKGVNGRFPVKLPKITDSQMLFTMNGLDKLNENGKMAIIQNGSPLFGDAGSPESELKQYLLDNDWLETIIRLSNDQFYNTGIMTYIWIISKRKSVERRNKVQLIDASECYEKRWKAVNLKKRDITEKCRKLILDAYGDFKNKCYESGDIKAYSKVMDKMEFQFNTVKVNKIEIKNGREKITDSFNVNIPKIENIDEYFNENILVYDKNLKLDKRNIKSGCEIPFPKYFYKFDSNISIDVMKKKIERLQEELRNNINNLFLSENVEKYDKIKNSNIEWIGNIPDRWNVKPHRDILKKKKNICEKYNGENILSLSMEGVKIKDLNNPSGKLPATFDGYQRVEKNNLLLCLYDIDVTPRCVGLIEDDGLTSPSYTQYEVLNENNPEYYNYLLRSIDDYKCFLHLTKNLRSTLRDSDFANIMTIEPSIKEQKIISEYLDKRLLEIDNVISKSLELVKELKEYKKILTYDCVTGKKKIKGE